MTRRRSRRILLLLSTLSALASILPTQSYQSGLPKTQVKFDDALSRRTYASSIGVAEQPEFAIVHGFRYVDKDDLSFELERSYQSKPRQQPFVLPPPKPTTTKSSSEHAYDKRIQEWADLYTSVDSLRQRFGSNHNPFWGDLDGTTARRLYKTLMPRALLPLAQVGVKPQDLAPLAYKARVAAKLYTRERSRVPERIGARLLDGFRSLRRYGTFNTKGMTYEQVWQKYRKVILDDCESKGSCSGLTEDDVTAQICFKILEKSCSTNQYIDKLFSSSDHELGEDLKQISETLEADVHRLLDPIFENKKHTVDYQVRRFQTLKKVARAKQRILGKTKKVPRRTTIA